MRIAILSGMLSASLAAGAGVTAHGAVVGSNINLSTLRGAVGSVSAYAEIYGTAQSPLHPTYNNELRAGVTDAFAPSPAASNDWWQVQFPGVVQVQNFDLQTYDSSYVPAQIEDFVVQTSTDGVNFTTQATVTNNLATRIVGSFAAPVSASYVRVTVFSDGTSRPNPADNQSPSYPLILDSARFTGPNAGGQDPRVSIVQSAWNTGVSLTAPNWTAFGPITELNDDALPTNSDARIAIAAHAFTPGVNPDPITFGLDGPQGIGAVGISTIGDDRAPRNIDVLVSNDGLSFDLVAQLRDIPYQTTVGPNTFLTPYNLYDVGWHAADVNFVRFQVRNDLGAYAHSAGGNDFIAELYVFVPEPGSLALLAAAAGLTLARRARRRYEAGVALIRPSR